MIEELERRLARYPAERYPVQHATAQLQLGVALVDAGRPEEAEQALARAVELFEPLPVERARARNALGAALRMLGRLDDAETAFAVAAPELEARDRGAALFNLGLVRRERGNPAAAVECLREALALLDAAAPARELGTALLELGRLEEATAILEEALARAGRDSEQAELGAAANILGLAQLAAGDAAAAAESFRSAAGAHPRSLRPAEYAMAKANLALAYERADDAVRARLAARQALAVAAAAAVVVGQAEGVLERLGPGSGDLVRVLAREPQERRAAIVREELARLLDAGPEEQAAAAAALVGAGFAEEWLGALLELPTAELETLAATGARPLDEPARREVARAMARFHVPQLLRLRETFERVAGGSWT